MRASIILLAPLAAFAIASPFAKRASLATSYTVNGFTTFTATPGSSPGNSTVSFSISDNLDNLSTCLYQTNANAASAADPSQFHACENPNFSFIWDGTSVTIVEFYSVSGSTFSAATSVNKPALFCFSSEGTPLGPGTQCETPTGQYSGDFVAMTTS